MTQRATEKVKKAARLRDLRGRSRRRTGSYPDPRRHLAGHQHGTMAACSQLVRLGPSGGAHPLPIGFKRGQPRTDSRKVTTASLKRSLRSPATMWPAPATSTICACGTSSRSSCAPSSLSRSLTRPRTSSVGSVRPSAACFEADGIDERRAGLVGAAEPAADERRIPVPVPAAVGAVAQVLGEPAEVRRARPVRVVALDRVGDVVEGREAVVHVLGHERADAHPALLLHPRRDVDEHERAGDVLVGVLADRRERRDPAERRAHQAPAARRARARCARTSPANASSV